MKIFKKLPFNLFKMEQQRERVLHLMAQKDTIENEIKELTGILDKNGIGMNEPLVDNEGFPLNSIDVYQVRHARHRIICLQNDHKNLMKQIEAGLEGYYSEASTLNSNGVNTMEVDVNRSEIVVHKTPFVKINLVSEGSPADYAGIKVNDEIVEFGSINATNYKNITDIATLVQHSEGSKVGIKLKRDNRFITVQLIPKKWTGRGLLGCNIIPL